MPHESTLDLGGVEVTPILGGRMRLDGGAMFGVVPKALWAPVCPPDERNRVANACRCLLVRTADHLVLVETGCGDRFAAKEREIFAVDGSVSLRGSLAAAGASPAEITHVVLTHLHFDHAAGAVVEAAGDLRPAFPDAVHIAQAGEGDDARAGRSIMRSSYRPADLQGLAGVRWSWAEGDGEVVPGIRVEVTGGHTGRHQAVVVRGARETVVFPGDLIPTRNHLRPYWIMAYDMHPYDTLVRKQALAFRAGDEGWIVAWDHDPGVAFSRLQPDGRGGWTAVDVGAP